MSDRLISRECLPLKSPNSQYNCVEVAVYYTLGGYSYFTHSPIERGYYVSARPTSRSVSNGIVTETYAVFDRTGYKRFLKSANRYTSKGAERALVDAQPWVEHMLNLLAEQGLEVANKVT